MGKYVHFPPQTESSDKCEGGGPRGAERVSWSIMGGFFIEMQGVTHQAGDQGETKTTFSSRGHSGPSLAEKEVYGSFLAQRVLKPGLARGSAAAPGEVEPRQSGTVVILSAGRV